MATPLHLQYNSPMGLYSREAATEQLEQQIGHVAAPLQLPMEDKHFDPAKSQVLKELQRSETDSFGLNFDEKIARAETPKVPLSQARHSLPLLPPSPPLHPPLQEPSWVSTARDKSERARSRTPGAREATPSDPYNYPHLHHGTPAEEAREYAEKSRTFVHHNDDHWRTPYYQVQREAPRQRSSSFHGPSRGYEMGGSDFTAGMHFESLPYGYYDAVKRESSQPPPVAGTDFGTGAVGFGPYHGHGPDPPRLRPRYTADSRAPLNPFVAPGIDSTDPNHLVGDTLSNQKCPPPPPHVDTSFGTSFAPPQGHMYSSPPPLPLLSPSSPPPLPPPPPSSPPSPPSRTDHRFHAPPPRPVEPVTFSLSAKKGLGGFSSAPSYYSKEGHGGFSSAPSYFSKEISPRTLLTDEALLPQRREATPDWVGHSLSKANGWKNRSDPRLDRSLEVYYTEPNWKRNVDQRRQAWERRAFETEQRLNRPAHAKIPPGGVPAWASDAHSKHGVWERAATEVGRGGSSTLGPLPPIALPSHDIISHPSPGGYSVHSTSLAGDRNSGNFSSSEHFEREARDVGKFEKSSYSHSESKSTTVNGQPAPVSALSTYSTGDGGVLSSSPISRPLSTHHVANGVETNLLNRGFNTNQINYLKEHQAAPTPHHHGPAPTTAPFSSSTTIPISHSQGGTFTRTQSSFIPSQSQGGAVTGGQSSIFPISQSQGGSATGGQSSYEHYSMSKREEKTEETRPLPSPPSTHSQQYSMRRHEERSEETRPIVRPSIETRSEFYSNKRHEERKEETRTVPLPVQESSHQHYKRTHETRTEESRPVSAASHYSTHQTTLPAITSSDVFDRRAEMAETLPHGSISNTLNNTQGGYRDQSGHDISYKRELATSADPGKEISLLKEEERRVIEKPLEPGVISRHVTTKYYKKKTTTDTTTTTS